MNLNSRLTLKRHQDLIKHKGILNQVYRKFYREFGIRKLKEPVVELGSGGGFLKELYPKVITSDIVKGQNIDKIFEAEKMPFKSGSVGSFVMLDTFHHIKDPERALKEMERCLKVSGKIVMVEPYNSTWGRFIYQNFHHEKFIPSADWKISGKGRLTGANGALPWIVFVRDRKRFEKTYPKLKITKVKPHTPLGYLISGGLSRPQILPTNFYKYVNFMEKNLNFMNKYLGMFVTIEIEKNKG